MSWDDPLGPLGLDLKLAAAGALGGVVRWFVKPRPGGLMPNIGIVVVGTITAAYLTPIVAHMLAIELQADDPGVFMLASAYLIGASGEWAIQWAMGRWRRILYAAVDGDGPEDEYPRRRRRDGEDDFPEAG